MSEIWWLDPAKNTYVGGTLEFHKYLSNVQAIDIANTQYRVGFNCKAGLSVYPYNYESKSKTSYVRFTLPSGLGNVESAVLYLCALDGDLKTDGSWINDVDVNVYYKDSVDYMSADFPIATLDEGDYFSSWYFIGSLDTSMYDIISQVGSNFNATPTWFSIDVTDAVINSKNNVVAFSLSASFDSPDGWDYTVRPYNYDEYFWLAFVGPLGVSLQDPPTGNPIGISHATPWLKVTYDGAIPQSEPGETITTDENTSANNSVLCIAADPKARVALVGTALGSLYVSTSDGIWNKIYEIS